MAAQTNDRDCNSGSRSLEGFIYQRDVSVWLALKLLIETGTSDALMIEAPNEEDVETAMTAPDTAESRVEVKLPAHTLTVQIKSKGNGPWTPAPLRDVLTKRTQQDHALKLLEDPDRHHLMITDADASRGLRKLLVSSPLRRASVIPELIAKAATTDVSNRIGLLTRLDRTRLDLEIPRTLTRRYKVPLRRQADCYKALGEAVFELMRQGGGWLTREDVKRIIRDHEGFLGAFDNTEIFVEPNNMDEMRASLTTKHAIVLRGPSGTGKTTVAKRLIQEVLSERDPQQPDEGLPRDHKRVTTPGELTSRSGLDPVIFEIEDPFGQYKAALNAADWAGSLSGSLKRATQDRKIVVTTRKDLFDAAKPEDLTEFIIDLEADDYSPRTRIRLFNAYLGRMPDALQRMVHAHRKMCLDELSTPLEFDKFFGSLEGFMLDGKTDRQRIRDLLEVSKDTVIEERLSRSVRANGQEIEAALAWGLLIAFPILEQLVLDEVISAMEDNPGLLPLRHLDNLDGFFLDLVDKRSLRPKNLSYAVRHNRDEKGLRESFDRCRRPANRALSQLVDTLIRHESEDLKRGGVALAAKIIRDPDLELRTTSDMQEELDRLLIAEALSADGPTAGADYENLALLGSKDLPEVKVAQWLQHREHDPTNPFSHFFGSWVPIEDGDEFYTDMAAPSVPALLRGFVTHVLPGLRDHPFPGLAERLYRIDPGIGPTYRQAFIDHVDILQGVNAEALLDGAVEELDACGGLISALREELSDLAKIDGFTSKQAWENVNDIMPPEQVEHLSEDGGMDIWECEQRLDTLIEHHRHRQGGWRALIPLLTTPETLKRWMTCINLKDAPASDNELKHLKTALERVGRETVFWERLASKETRYRAEAWEVVCDRDPGPCRDAALCHWAAAGKPDIETAVTELRNKAGSAGVVETVYAIARANLLKGRNKKVRKRLRRIMTEEERIVFDALRYKGPALSETTMTVGQLEAYRRQASRFYDLGIVGLQAQLGKDIVEYLETALSKHGSPYWEDRRYYKAVARTALSAGMNDLLLRHLDHPHAIVAKTLAKATLEGAPTFPEALRPLFSSRSRDILDLVMDWVETVDFETAKPVLEGLLLNDAYSLNPGARYTLDYSYADKAAKLLIASADAIETAAMKEWQARAYEVEEEDYDLCVNLIWLLVKFGDAPIRQSLFEKACAPSTSGRLREAIFGIFALDGIHPDLSALSRREIAMLLGGGPIPPRRYFAVSLGRAGSAEQVEVARKVLAKYTNLAPLALPLAFGLEGCGRNNESAGILNTLEVEIRGKIKRVFEDGAMLTPSDLDGLGHIAIRDSVRTQFEGHLIHAKSADTISDADLASLTALSPD